MTPVRTIVFATNNAHKLEEIRSIVGSGIRILSLADIGCHDDIPEDADTFEGNALQKALYVKEHYGYDCFADDSGLIVDALGGEPGVRSARYAGSGHDSKANMALLLKNLEGVECRTARFVTVIALIEGDERRFFEGKVEGRILEHEQGTGGFGYDPVFLPDGFTETFACMAPEQKNAISHRGRATQKLLRHLSDVK